MQLNPTKNFECTQKYSTQDACLKELNRHHWTNGFICPKCSHDKSYQLKYRHLHLYKEGIGDRWAYPVPPEHFNALSDLFRSLKDFMEYCKIVNPPTIRRGLFT